MAGRSELFPARVLSRESLGPHLLRLVIGGEALQAGLTPTGMADEWVSLVVPGQFQSRYYTIRSFGDGEVTLDVVVHEVGLVTDWARADPEGDEVQIGQAQGSFRPPEDAEWLVLVGDLTAAPAMARIAEETSIPQVQIVAEAPEQIPGYLPEDTTWVTPPTGRPSGLAEIVRGLTWPDGPGYFWMAGESSQMRAIRKYVMAEGLLPRGRYDMMGYWRPAPARRV